MILKSEVIAYQAGNIKNCYKAWSEITSDCNILSVAKHGTKIDFRELPWQNNPVSHPLSSSEILTVDKEICKLLRKKVIVETSGCEGDFVSPVFTRPKKDGNRRMIFNLKQLNSFVVYQHFKMEGLDNVLNLIKPNVWMASVDLKDAFFSIQVHPEYQK